MSYDKYSSANPEVWEGIVRWAKEEMKKIPQERRIQENDGDNNDESPQNHNVNHQPSSPLPSTFATPHEAFEEMPKSQESDLFLDFCSPKTSSNTGIQSLDPPAGIRLPPELTAELYEHIRTRNLPKSQESHVPFDHRFPKTSSNTGIQSLDPPAGIRLPPELMAQLHEPIRARNLPKSQESDLFLDFCSPDTSSNTGIQFLDPPFDLTTQLEYLRTCNALRSSSLLSSQKIQSSPKSSAEAAHKVLAPSNDDHRSSPLSIRTRKQSLPLPQNHGIRKPSSLPPPVTHAMKDQFMKDRLTKEGRQPTGEEEKNSDLSELDGDGSPCRLELGAQDNCQIHISF